MELEIIYLDETCNVKDAINSLFSFYLFGEAGSLVEAVEMTDCLMRNSIVLKEWTMEVKALPNGMPEITVKRRIIH